MFRQRSLFPFVLAFLASPEGVRSTAYVELAIVWRVPPLLLSLLDRRSKHECKTLPFCREGHGSKAVATTDKDDRSFHR